MATFALYGNGIKRTKPFTNRELIETAKALWSKSDDATAKTYSDLSAALISNETKDRYVVISDEDRVIAVYRQPADAIDVIIRMAQWPDDFAELVKHKQ